MSSIDEPYYALTAICPGLGSAGTYLNVFRVPSGPYFDARKRADTLIRSHLVREWMSPELADDFDFDPANPPSAQELWDALEMEYQFILLVDMHFLDEFVKRFEKWQSEKLGWRP